LKKKIKMCFEEIKEIN